MPSALRPLRCVRAVVDDSEEKKPGGRRLPSWVPVVLLVPGLVLAALCITQPFNLHGQIVFLALMFVSMIVLMRIRARITLMLLFVISFVVSGRYLWWRCTSTVSTGNGLDLFFGVLLLVAEVYAFSVMVLGYFQVCWVLDRKPAALPADRSVWPHVDIFIPTYNESLDVIKPTVYAALNMDWPADKLHVYVLDDGSRDFIQAFAEAAGAGYIKREEHNHAKAGNINHAMTVTSGEYIVIFDCDHVPRTTSSSRRRAGSSVIRRLHSCRRRTTFTRPIPSRRTCISSAPCRSRTRSSTTSSRRATTRGTPRCSAVQAPSCAARLSRRSAALRSRP